MILLMKISLTLVKEFNMRSQSMNNLNEKTLIIFNLIFYCDSKNVLIDKFQFIKFLKNKH
jgi:hypothetical protein